MNISRQAKIKTAINNLAGLCLENSGEKTDYCDEDLSDAVLIFMEVFSNKMYDHLKDQATQEGLSELFKTTGSVLRSMIRESTGVDLHDVYKDIK